MRGPRSLPLAILLGIVVFGVAIPLTQWGLSLTFEAKRIPAGPVWLGFVAVLLVTGAAAGAVVHAAALLPRGWRRIYVYGVVFALAMRAEIDEFATTPLATWLVLWVLASLALGLIMGAVFHALSRANRPPPAP